jgi:serine/threonine protein kinase
MLMILSNRTSFAGCIEAVHAAGVLHNDLQPQNVVISDSGSIHLIDFSHATTHKCEGWENCPELIKVTEIIQRE